MNLLRFLLLCSLCIVMPTARAQYASIPDSSFGNWLHNNGYSACLTGNSVNGYRLDTTCPAVLHATSIVCYDQHLVNLTGIQYFKHLTYLDCSENNITIIPSLPDSLITFICYVNQLRHLPALPATLTTLNAAWNYHLTLPPTLPSGLVSFECDLDSLTSLPTLPSTLLFFSCNNNHLTSLPASLPPGLQSMDVSGNLLTILPSIPATVTNLITEGNPIHGLPTLPPRLIHLDCGKSPIRSLPGSLPVTLRTLYCENDSLSTMPPLPDTLIFLNCSNNSFTSMPVLDASLQLLDCSHNQLTSMPKLPTSLQYLGCQNNQIRDLPPVPPFLHTLRCGHNLLTSLPSLPDSIRTLDCSYNAAISCLPHIYQNVLDSFYVSGTGVSCIPNRFTAVAYDTNPAIFPLCTPANGCDFYYNLAGNIHNDTSATCSLDKLYPGQPVTGMKVQLIKNAQVVQQFYTFNSGGYTFKTDSLTSYTISIDTTGLPLSIACPSFGSIAANLSPADSVQLNNDFGMSCSGVDFGVSYISGSHFRITRTTPVHIGAGNLARLRYNADCGAGTSGTVSTILTGPLQYVSPASGALTPTSVSGNTLTYNIADLDSLHLGSLDIIVLIDTSTQAGTQVCISVIIAPFTAHSNADTLTECFTTIDSWDPNHKSVYPPDSITSGDWLTYNIDFQNTGTDTAYTVVVKDTLSPNVDASTFQYLASSSKAVVQLFGNVVVFTFPKINLVDSATNPPLSTGWVEYKVKAKTHLAVGNVITNTAYIYFDQNPAVVTNTTVNVIDLDAALGIRTVTASDIIHLYPNPNKGTFTLETSNSTGSTYTITDMLGHVITQQAITTDKQTINMSEVADGVYTLIVRGAKPQRFTVVR